MKEITRTLAGIALGCCLASNVAQAASIQSMTIEEIGVASGGLGTSAFQSKGGEVRAFDPSGSLFQGDSFGAVSTGSTNGAIIMGSTQGDNAFTLGFTQAGIYYGELNTLRGAPSGAITDSVMSLNLSGFTAEFGGYSFSVSPANHSLITSALMINTDHYYYTADWFHIVTNDEVFSLTTQEVTPAFAGWLLVGHLEGIATLAPVPEADTYAMMLAGLGLVGFMAHRRRKLV
jgi:hypothetical protein